MNAAPDKARLLARIYAAIHRGNDGDVAFYRRACHGARRVLELGCGTGRILRAVAAQGTLVTGLDIDRAALAEARASLPRGLRGRVALACADMRSFDFGAGTFDRVLIPYNGLYTLPSDEDMVRCLAEARRHLRPEGRVLLDAYAADDEADLPDEPDEFEYLVTIALDPDTSVDVFEREAPARGPRSLRIDYRYEVRRDGDAGEPEVLETSIRHHFLLPEYLHAILAQAGLRATDLWGDFEGAPFRPGESEVMVVAAVAAPR